MQITILPKGKDKKHHAVIKQATCFFLNKLMGKRKQKKIKSITIRLADSIDYGASRGDCREVIAKDGSFDIYFKVLATDPLPEMISTLAHEAVHAKQSVTGELVIDGDDWIWKGRRRAYNEKWYNGFTYKEQYAKLPWETEAYDKEMELARSFFWQHYSSNN